MEVPNSEDHAIFNTDPAEWMQYIHKEVCVCTTRGTSHSGWVYTIDPVSQTIALIRLQDDAKELEFVMGHAVKSIFVLDSDTEKKRSFLEKLFQSGEMLSISPEELKKRKDMVKSWLLKNRIPVSVTGEHKDILCISDALFIEPPYNASNCRSTNEIILGRVQGLIKNIPPDVQEWWKNVKFVYSINKIHPPCTLFTYFFHSLGINL